MILKDKEGKIQSETHMNLETMQRYIRQHFARMREKWEITCITEDEWAKTPQAKLKKTSTEHIAKNIKTLDYVSMLKLIK